MEIKLQIREGPSGGFKPAKYRALLRVLACKIHAAMTPIAVNFAAKPEAWCRYPAATILIRQHIHLFLALLGATPRPLAQLRGILI
jgi:hypothetical protein